MLMRLRGSRAQSLFMAWTLAAMAASAHATVDPMESFDLSVPVAPAPLRIDGSDRLFYELHLTNFVRVPLTLTRVEVVDAGNGAVVAELTGDALQKRLGKIAPQPAGTDPLSFATGERGVVYFEIELKAQPRPRNLIHRIGYRAVRTTGVVDAQVEGARVAIDASPVPVFGAPLRGGPWAAVYGPWWERGHRRVVYTVDGRARIPARFAIDFIKLDNDGRRAKEGGDWLRGEYGYAEDVLAVADGVVAVVLDGYPERVQPDQPHPKKSLVDAAGNYVVLDIGGGRYAFYEHLMPGSVRVKPGERVRRGQVIASLGSTGDSSKPHLHFHVADGVSTLGAEGRPFVLQKFRVLGRYEDDALLGKAPWQALGASEPRERAGEMPGPITVIEFGGAAD